MSRSHDADPSASARGSQPSVSEEGPGANPQEPNRLPRVEAIDAAGESARIDLFVPYDLACLEGHFPDIAIVPGVVMIGWAEHFARETLGCNGELHELDRLKFNQLVRPGRSLVLELTQPQAAGQGYEVGYRFQSPADGRDLASGRLVFH